MPRVVHFEIHADKPDRAVKFYTDLFGWKIDRMPGPMDYWLITTGPNNEPGINGGLMERRGEQSGDKVISYVCTVDVPAIDEYTKRAVALGGKNVVPKMAIPAVGWLTYCNDTEGNIFGLMQADPNAK